MKPGGGGAARHCLRHRMEGSIQSDETRLDDETAYFHRSRTAGSIVFVCLRLPALSEPICTLLAAGSEILFFVMLIPS